MFIILGVLFINKTKSNLIYFCYLCLILLLILSFSVVSTEKLNNELYKTIVNMNFATKYNLMLPFFAENFPKEAKEIWKLNNLRNDIFHGKAVKDAKFKGKSISEEETVEEIFISAQMATIH